MHDMIIIGSGLAGSSLAAMLSRQGWDIALIERRHLPQHKVCGEFLSPEVQASFRALGLYDTVLNLSPARMDRARLTTPAGVQLEVALPGQAWGISRFALDVALLDAAAQAGTTVQMGAAATSVTPTAHGYAVAVRSSQEDSLLYARSAVVACGRHPPAGLRVRAEQEQTPSDQTHVGVKCHYSGISMPPQVELYLFPGGYAGLSPVEQGRVNLCLLATRQAFTYAGASITAMLEAICHWNPALSRRLSGGQIIADTRLAVAPVDLKRSPVPWDGVARLGDAVTMIPPLCGDGMAMAVRSAELCAPLAHEFLRGRISLESWQQRYCQLWHQEFDRALYVGRWLQTLLVQPGVSDMVLLLGKLMPLLARQAVHATRSPGSISVNPLS